MPPPGYLQAAREICDQAGALLILDEIQTGFGRTGAVWACDHEGVKPDMMTLGKALGGGVMPIGAFMARPEIWEVFHDNPYIHTSTFGGSPLACRAAIAAIEVLERSGHVPSGLAPAELLAGIQQVGAEFPELVEDVRGKGLLVGVQFAEADLGNLVIAGLAQENILTAFTLNRPEVIRLEPPAVITSAEIQRVVQAFRQAIASAKDLLQL